MGRVVTGAGFKALVEPPGRGELIGRGPYSGREPGKEGGANRRGLGHDRALNCPLQLVGLDLHEQVVGRGPAVDAQGGTGRSSGRSACAGGSVINTRTAAQPDVGGHRVNHIADFEGDRLERRPGQMCRGRAPGQAEYRATCIGVPVRRAEPGERGHEHDTA